MYGELCDLQPSVPKHIRSVLPKTILWIDNKAVLIPILRHKSHNVLQTKPRMHRQKCIQFMISLLQPRVGLLCLIVRQDARLIPRIGWEQRQLV